MVILSKLVALIAFVVLVYILSRFIIVESKDLEVNK